MQYLELGESSLRTASVVALSAGHLLSGDLGAAHDTLVEAIARCDDQSARGLILAHVYLGDEAARRGLLGAASAEYETASGWRVGAQSWSTGRPRSA
jgi:hypothetical protein